MGKSTMFPPFIFMTAYLFSPVVCIVARFFFSIDIIYTATLFCLIKQKKNIGKMTEKIVPYHTNLVRKTTQSFQSRRLSDLKTAAELFMKRVVIRVFDPSHVKLVNFKNEYLIDFIDNTSITSLYPGNTQINPYNRYNKHYMLEGFKKWTTGPIRGVIRTDGKTQGFAKLNNANLIDYLVYQKLKEDNNFDNILENCICLGDPEKNPYRSGIYELYTMWRYQLKTFLWQGNTNAHQTLVDTYTMFTDAIMAQTDMTKMFYDKNYERVFIKNAYPILVKAPGLSAYRYVKGKIPHWNNTSTVLPIINNPDNIHPDNDEQLMIHFDNNIKPDNAAIPVDLMKHILETDNIPTVKTKPEDDVIDLNAVTIFDDDDDTLKTKEWYNTLVAQYIVTAVQNEVNKKSGGNGSKFSTNVSRFSTNAVVPMRDDNIMRDDIISSRKTSKSTEEEEDKPASMRAPMLNDIGRTRLERDKLPTTEVEIILYIQRFHDITSDVITNHITMNNINAWISSYQNKKDGSNGLLPPYYIIADVKYMLFLAIQFMDAILSKGYENVLLFKKDTTEIDEVVNYFLSPESFFSQTKIDYRIQNDASNIQNCNIVDENGRLVNVNTYTVAGLINLLLDRESLVFDKVSIPKNPSIRNHLHSSYNKFRNSFRRNSSTRSSFFGKNIGRGGRGSFRYSGENNGSRKSVSNARLKMKNITNGKSIFIKLLLIAFRHAHYFYVETYILKKIFDPTSHKHDIPVKIYDIMGSFSLRMKEFVCNSLANRAIKMAISQWVPVVGNVLSKVLGLVPYINKIIKTPHCNGVTIINNSILGLWLQFYNNKTIGGRRSRRQFASKKRYSQKIQKNNGV